MQQSFPSPVSMEHVNRKLIRIIEKELAMLGKRSSEGRSTLERQPVTDGVDHSSAVKQRPVLRDPSPLPSLCLLELACQFLLVTVRADAAVASLGVRIDL